MSTGSCFCVFSTGIIVIRRKEMMEKCGCVYDVLLLWGRPLYVCAQQENCRSQYRWKQQVRVVAPVEYLLRNTSQLNRIIYG